MVSGTPDALWREVKAFEASGLMVKVLGLACALSDLTMVSVSLFG